MSVSYKIFAESGIAVVRYSGFMSLEESAQSMAQYMSDPLFKPGQKLLVDLTDITDWERDYVSALKLQSQKADQLHPPGVPALVVAIAPHAVAQSLANFVSAFWDKAGNVKYLVAFSADEAMEMLGVPAETRDEIWRPID